MSDHTVIVNWVINTFLTNLDKVVGWYHQPNGHEFEQTLGDSEGQGRLACCSPWGHKEPDMTERLNNKQQIFLYGSSVFSCHLFLISSASVRALLFLSFIVPIFA